MKKLLSIFGILLILVTNSNAQVSESGDFLAYIDAKIATFPGVGTDEFVEPTVNQTNTWNDAVTQILNEQYVQAHSTLSGIEYRLTEYTDNVSGSVFYIAEKESSSSNHWGIYVFNPASLRTSLVIQSPHPKYDLHTGAQGAYLFRELGAFAFLMSGTHRCNSPTLSTCSGTTGACGSTGPYKISDEPHNTNTIYQSATENVFNTIPNSVFIQLHGFTKEGSDPYLIMSNGTQIPPQPIDFLSEIRDELYAEDNVLTFKIAHLDDWTRLIATTNVQGRMINSAPNPCLDYSPGNNGRFIHIEQERTRLRDDIEDWDKVKNAFSRVFPVDGGTNTVVTFKSMNSSVNETVGTINIEFDITNPGSTQATTVDVALTTGSAADISNYTTQTVTFPAGSSATQTITLTITDDSEDEGDEALIFTLQNVAGGDAAAIGTASAHALTIIDDDAPVFDLVVNEYMPWPAGSDADADGATIFDSNGDGTYSYNYDEYIELVNNAPNPIDLSGWKINDGIDRHIFPANTIVPAGGAIIVFGGATPTGTFGNSIVQTASESTSMGLFNTGDNLDVIDNTDAIRLSFSYGQSSRPVAFARVPDITGDFTTHPPTSAYTNEDGSDAWASPGLKIDGSFFGVAQDTKVQFKNTDMTVDEAAGNVNLNVSISNPSSSQATTVDIVLTVGDASDVNNYTTQTVTFPAGNSADQEVQVTVTDDLFAESNETLSFTLQNVDGGTNVTIGSPSNFDLTITDNDFPPIANFTSDVTNVAENGTVNFNDLSTNNPDNWSWSFPGGTPSSSTSQNPQVVYNTVGTYDVTLTVSNANGEDEEIKGGYITVIDPNACSTLNLEDFEAGWGIWNDGGGDASRSNKYAAYANSGIYTVRLTDNTNGSVMTTDNLDLSSYSSVDISFSYITNSMDDNNEDFWLQISTDGGSTFTTFEEWNLNDEFVNNQRYNETVNITGISFTGNTQFRFRCDASGNDDEVYIDDIEIKACGISALSMKSTTIGPKTKTEEMLQEYPDMQPINLYPNPANDKVTLDLSQITDQKADIYILNLQGKVMKKHCAESVSGLVSIDLSELNNGMYMVVVKSENQVKSINKLIINK